MIAPSAETEVRDATGSRSSGGLREQATHRLHEIRLQFQLVAIRHVEQAEQEAPGGVEPLRPRLDLQPFACRAELGTALSALPGRTGPVLVDVKLDPETVPDGRH